MRLAELAVEAGKDADAYVAIVDEAATAHARWAGNALTSSGLTADTRLTVIAVTSDGRGTAAGVVSHRGAVDEDAVRVPSTSCGRPWNGSPAPSRNPSGTPTSASGSTGS
ncbi:hypothetical protein AB0C69_33665, partial [Actinomadura sp. NPDC048032]